MSDSWKTGFIAALCVLLGAACGPQKPRDNIGAQNNAETAAKYSELQPAEGTYEGLMHLSRSGQDFKVIVEVRRVLENMHAPQSPDPTETVEVPKLSGSLHFPVLDDLDVSDLAQFSELTSPMGSNLTVSFDFGDYNPRSKVIVLPYSVPGYPQASFGQLSGKLVGDVFKGRWFSKPFGAVGTFDLRRYTGRD